MRLVGMKSPPAELVERSKRAPSGAENAENVEAFEALGRLPEHISRARARVRELAFCNEWRYFLTVTVDSANQARDDLGALKRRWNQCLKDYSKKYGERPRYLIIPETHHDGKSWHLHGLVSDFAQGSLVRNEHGYLDVPYFRSRFGWVSVSPVRDPSRTASYICKYITKDATATAAKLNGHEHMFFASQGLKGKELIWSGGERLLYPEGVEWAFENDWVKLSELEGEALDKFYERLIEWQSRT